MKTQRELDDAVEAILSMAREEYEDQNRDEVIWELAKAHCAAEGWTMAEETALMGELGF